MVSYEIDGQRYSYSTRNRAQVKEARERMAAARSSSSTRAQNEAERVANPLARIFTPPVPGQTPAPAAQAEDATASVRAGRVPRTETALKSRRSAKPSRAERRRLQQEARAEKARERRELIAERRQLAAEKRRKKLLAAKAQKDEAAQRLAAQRQAPADAVDTAQVVARSEPVEAPKKIDDPTSTQSLRPAPAKTVSFDLSSGIKTIERTDGTLQEEPFDTAAIARLGLADPVNDKALTDFVDQLRAPAR
jgi:hypothetical protein